MFVLAMITLATLFVGDTTEQTDLDTHNSRHILMNPSTPAALFPEHHRDQNGTRPLGEMAAGNAFLSQQFGNPSQFLLSDRGALLSVQTGLYSTNEEANALSSLDPASFLASNLVPDSGYTDPAGIPSGTHLVVVDSSVKNWRQLVGQLADHSNGQTYQLVVLNRYQDGLAQLTHAIGQHDRLSAVHLISHGDREGIRLGNRQVTEQLTAADQSQIESWREHLAFSADLFIYGCNLASSGSGRSLIHQLHGLSGADVAASEDLTGNQVLGGDWDLEYTVGSLGTNRLASYFAQSDWDGTLQTINITQSWLDAQGSSDGPYYLTQQNATYVLQTDVTTDGTAFAIVARNVTFDLNGHTITYNNADPISVTNHSFEQGSGGTANNWNFSNAVTGERYDGEFLQNQVYDGDHSLRFGVRNDDQYVTSTSNVTLEANTRYTLSSMFYFDGPGSDVANNPGVDLYVRLESLSSSNTHEVVWDNTNWRGMQLTERAFTTGGSSETFRIVAGVRHNSDMADHYGFIDNVKIQRDRTYGVTVSAHDWASAYYPGLNQWGWGHDATVTNGTITQGQDQGSWSHGVFVYSTPNATIDNVNLTVSGQNSSTIFGRDNNVNMTIKDNDLTSNVQTITTRDNFHGAVISGASGEVFGNTIHNGPHAGIYVGHGGTVIHDNTISLSARYTNAFAIVGGQEIYNNVIDSSQGDFNSRGIGIGGGSSSNPKKVYNNTITLQGKANNQEYGGAPLGGAYGIQAEGGGHVEIYGNTVTIYANETEGYAFRMNESTSGSNIHVHDNTFRAIRNNPNFDTAPIRLTDVVYQSLTFEDNIIESNDQFVGQSGGVDRAVLSNNTFRAVGDTTGFQGVETYNYNGNSSTAVVDLQFLDNIYLDSTSRDLLVNSPIYKWTGNGYDNASSFIHRFSTTFLVTDTDEQPVSNASVVVLDANDQQVFSGTTNASGQVTTVLDEFRTQGENKTSYGPYTVRAVVNSETEEVQFDADQKQTIEVAFGDGGGGDPPYEFIYNGSNLKVVADEENNIFTWTAANPLNLNIDGQDFSILAGTTQLRFETGGGNDHINLVGTTGNDVLVANPVGSSFTTSVMGISFIEAETHSINAGSAGNDSVYYRDSVGNDSFLVQDDYSRMTAVGWDLEATGFVRQIARSTTGGSDSLTLETDFESRLHGDPNSFTLTNMSGPQYKSALGFEDVTSSTTQGGSIYMVDTIQNDTFHLMDRSMQYSGGGVTLTADGFLTQVVTADNGGNDTLHIGDTGGQDSLFSRAGFTSLRTATDFYRGNNFEIVSGQTSQANDEVTIEDTLADEILTAGESIVSITGDGVTRSFSGFGQSILSFTGGDDSVLLVGSDGDDRLTGNPSRLRFITPGMNHYLRDFHTVSASGGLGNDLVSITDSALDDAVTFADGGMTFSNANVNIRTDGFEDQLVFSLVGGNDTLTFVDTFANDNLVSNGDFTAMYNRTNYNRASGFNQVEWISQFTSDHDELVLSGNPGTDDFHFDGDVAAVSNANRNETFTGFDSVQAYWNSDEDTLFLGNVNYDLEIIDES